MLPMTDPQEVNLCALSTQNNNLLRHSLDTCSQAYRPCIDLASRSGEANLCNQYSDFYYIICILILYSLILTIQNWTPHIGTLINACSLLIL